VDLGWDPPQGALLLPIGGPFSATLVASAAWDTMVAALDLYIEGDGSPVTWTATLDGTSAVWDEDTAEVSAILTSGKRTATLRGTPPGGEPTPWYRLAIRAV